MARSVGLATLAVVLVVVGVGLLSPGEVRIHPETLQDDLDPATVGLRNAKPCGVRGPFQLLVVPVGGSRTASDPSNVGSTLDNY